VKRAEPFFETGRKKSSRIFRGPRRARRDRSGRRGKGPKSYILWSFNLCSTTRM